MGRGFSPGEACSEADGPAMGSATGVSLVDSGVLLAFDGGTVCGTERCEAVEAGDALLSGSVVDGELSWLYNGVVSTFSVGSGGNGGEDIGGEVARLVS